MTSTIERRVIALADPRRAKALLWFFKTGPGQYGEGDRFLGLTLPQVRALAREFRDAPLPEMDALLHSPWHESRTLALAILVHQFARTTATSADRRRIYQFYMRRTTRINNWDLVDISAPRIVGAYLYETTRPPRALLRRLARSRNLWERRIAIVSTHWFIRNGQFSDTLTIARILMRDEHDLIHKATGWMLREVGKRDEKALRRFLDRFAGALPRTALRYSLERLPVSVRRRYMAVPRTHVRRAR